MKKLIAIVISAAALCGSATQYSCLSIITEAKKAGKWDALKAWISASGMKDEWDKCHYVSDNYPLYSQITNALVSSGIVTTDDIKSILSASVDPAIPDDMLYRVVSNDCTTAHGRVKWHGSVVTNVVDTNAMTKTQVHQDGYCWVEHFSKNKPLTIDDHLSAAERAKKREEAKKRLEAAKAKKKAERIAELQTNMVVLATAYAKEKKYPIELATMLLQHELNTLVGTNIVDAVVGPQN